MSTSERTTLVDTAEGRRLLAEHHSGKTASDRTVAALEFLRWAFANADALLAAAEAMESTGDSA